jgi:hypothetical protein
MVLLISLKAGGVGLNLTNANHAFMVSNSLSLFPSRTFREEVGHPLTGRWYFPDGLLVERGC